MDVDKGVSRQLPPIEKQQTPTQVNSNLVMKIYIASDNKVKVNEQPILIGKLRPVIKHFIENKGKTTSSNWAQVAKPPMTPTLKFRTR